MKPESLVISWCDTGSTDSLFASSLASLVLNATHEFKDIGAVGINQVVGNQIARQRQDALRNFENMDCDWMLWVDSDIVVTQPAFNLLWKNRDAVKRPVVSGVYFVTMEPNQPLPAPAPCIFNIVNDENGRGNLAVHPLPENQLIPIDVAGLGFTLMHKSVAKKLREAYGETTFEITIGKQHISEDVSFFYKLKDLGIPVHAHTGAHVPHIKRFFFDINYYNLWWQTVAPLRQQQVKE